MSNSFYTHGAFPSTGSAATSASMRAELDLISAGFDKMPTLSGNANLFVVINSTGTGLTQTSSLPSATFTDTLFTIQDDGDNTRKFQFNASTVTPGATRIYSVPDANTTLVGTDTTQTLTNKTLTAPVISSIVNTGSLSLPTSTDTLVGRATTDTLTNKTLTSPVIATIVNTGTLTLPTSTDTLVGRATTDTLTNKTLTSPVIATIVNTGTLTLPTSTDTLVGRATTDTLTNKTLTSPVIATIVNTGTLTLPTSTDTLVGRATTDTLTNKTLTSPVIATIVNTGTLTLPTSTDTLVGRATTDTLTNKTLGAFTISGTVSGGGNQINNVIIGASTPLAGSFTTLSTTGLASLPSTGRSAAAALTVTNPAFLYGVASTYTDTASSGVIAAMAPFYSISGPTLSTSNVTTYTNSATLYIANAPTAGGSATITNPYAVYVAAGAAYFGGAVTFAGSASLAALTVTSLTNSGLTSGRVVYSTTGGLETDSANLTFNGTTLTANTIGAFTLSGTIAGGGNQINNVIIGTSTPLAGAFTTLSATGVATFSAGSAAAPAITTTGDTNTGIFFPAADTIAFAEGGAEAMRIDSSGNLGIGVTPSAWGSIIKPIEFANSAYIGGQTNSTAAFYAGANAYYNGTNWIYKTTALATNYISTSGQHQWYNAPSGTAGNAITFTQAMTLDASGNLGIGVTPSAWTNSFGVIQGLGNWSISHNGVNGNSADFLSNAYRSGGVNTYLYIGSTSATRYQQLSGVHAWYNAPSGTAGNAITFTQAMTLNASGNLGLGVTPSAWNAGKVLQIGTGGSLWNANSSTDVQLGSNFYYSSGFVYSTTNAATRYTQNAGVHAWHNAASGTAGNTITFTQAMTLDASGNLLVGQTTGNLGGRIEVTAASGYNAVSLQSVASTSAAVLNIWGNQATGDQIFVRFATDSNTVRGSITYNRAGGLVAYNTTSDYRAKDIYGPISDSGALIDSVPVYMGKMKGATQERPMFVAHETPTYAHTGEKDAVDADGNPVYQQMDAGALIPVMWAEIQSLRKRLAAAGI